METAVTSNILAQREFHSSVVVCACESELTREDRTQLDVKQTHVFYHKTHNLHESAVYKVYAHHAPPPPPRHKAKHKPAWHNDNFLLLQRKGKMSPARQSWWPFEVFESSVVPTLTG